MIRDLDRQPLVKDHKVWLRGTINWTQLQGKHSMSHFCSMWGRWEGPLWLMLWGIFCMGPRRHLSSNRSHTLVRYLGSELRKQKSRQRMKFKNRDQSVKCYLKRRKPPKQSPAQEVLPTNKYRNSSSWADLNSLELSMPIQTKHLTLKYPELSPQLMATLKRDHSPTQVRLERMRWETYQLKNHHWYLCCSNRNPVVCISHREKDKTLLRCRV